MIIIAYCAYKGLYGVRVFYSFAGVDVKNCSPGVSRLDVILEVQGLENIVGKIYRQLRRISVERFGFFTFALLFVGAYYVVKFALVDLCQAIRRPFRRSGFEVVIVSCFFLVKNQFISHVVQDFFCEGLTFRGSNIPTEKIHTCLIHPDKSNGREVVLPVFLKSRLYVSQVVLGIGIKVAVGKIFQHLSFCFETFLGGIHQPVETLHKFIFTVG